VAGQEATARRLRATLRSGRLPHALLFTGSPGTGRLQVARDLAHVVLCTDSREPDGWCGSCPGCRAFQANGHPDYVEVGVPSGRQQLPIAVIRDLQHAAGLKPVRAARRVFVVKDVERITIEAANCFLKTLEEPPGGALCILLASSLRRIPETIVSRCRVVRFANIEPGRLAEELQRGGLDDPDAQWLARRCWGSPGLAGEFAEKDLAAINRELLSELAGLGLGDNLRLSDWLNARAAALGGPGPGAREALQELLECAAGCYRDMALAAAGCDEALLFNGAAAGEVRRAAEGGSTDEFLERADLVLETLERVGANANSRLALDRMFTRLARLPGGHG
jgi:DNA polymerase-3 subunit delta'